MKKYIALLLLLVMQTSLLNQWSMVMFYQVNRQFIAQNFCVNKDKPKLNCNGQCYLAKQLKKQEEKETKSNSEKLEKLPEINLVFEETVEFHFTPYLKDPIVHAFGYSNLYTHLFNPTVLHPPSYS
ncbi:hypothetical protein EOJ36_11110 [Sandaracinomonas limnophila]|uniref:Uncharacterized protein n=1 Tax=Sandaracinomonas limnophila TaxID=1862386 RepID=A0A437PMX4_9BACT|nr:hypothetical protein [Sandaracinomonas limnophila]RVU23617.1 hypothetical protein EOJ36_11110 [Sandaracinomonas limnophila]